MNPTTKTSVGNETVDQTVARAKSMVAGFKPGTPPPTTSGMSSDFSSSIIAELEKRMMGSGSGVSSRDSGVQKTIQDAIKAQQGVQESAAGRIQTDYEYEKQFMLSGAESSYNTATESGRGFATQLAALNKLTENTNKNLRDLDQRKQDALTANDAQTAARIADLQLKAIEFQQQSEQQFYSNAFSLMGLDLQSRAQDRAGREFAAKMEFDREQRAIDRQDNMARIAAQYGVEMTGDDTYETLSAKIAKIADEERRISATKALDGLKDEEQNLVYDDILSSSISKGMTAQEAALSVVKTMREAGQLLSRDEYNKIFARAQEMYSDYEKTKSRNEAEQGGGFLSWFFGRSGNRTPVPVDVFQTTPAFGAGVSTSTPKTPEEIFFGVPDYKLE